MIDPDAPRPEPWRNRIVGEGQENPTAITKNPLNWRVHPKLQRLTLEDSLDTIGWIQRPVINRTTGHLIDGHLRVASAAARGEQSIPVTYVELTEIEERAALASLDPMAGMAVMDGEKLAELLEDLEIGGGELNTLFDDLREQAEESTLSVAARTGKGLLGKNQPVVKAVIAVTEIDLIERSLVATGIASRGAALLLICREYLTNHPEATDEKGQHDLKPQNEPTPLAAAQDPEPDHLGDPWRGGPDLGANVQRDPAGSGVRGEVAESLPVGDPAPHVVGVRGGLRKVAARGGRRAPKH